jgi:hypothetical protein
MNDFDWIEDIKNSGELTWNVKSSWFARRLNRKLEKSFREWMNPNGLSIDKIVGTFDISLQSFGYRYVFIWVYLSDGRMLHFGNCFPSPGLSNEYSVHMYSDEGKPIGFYTFPKFKPKYLINWLDTLE